MGPLLFILFCNDIKLLPLYSKLILFADDTTLINHHKNKVFLHFTLQHDMEMFNEWFNANKLSLNPTKIVMVNFWSEDTMRPMCINGLEIPQVSSTKFFGVHLDQLLKWNVHISQLHNKLTANKYLLSTNKNLVNRGVLHSIYFAHIYSHINYGLNLGPDGKQKIC